jgi:cation:H+ antiporter
MNLITAFILLAGGLLVLWKSADLLVSGAVALAQRFGVSSFVVGLTIVAMGTSAPEVAASIAAALRGAGDVAIGNVYGSNIANLALVGGISALIAPVAVKKIVLYREMPAMILVAFLLWPIFGNMMLSRVEGVMLLGVFGLFLALTVYAAKKDLNSQKDISTNEKQTQAKQLSISRCSLYCVIGFAGLAIGADITVRAAVFIGQWAGLSEAVIGLTIIAFGTSLPELVTCVVAALKGHNDISIGNLVGSNIFNTLLVTGIAGLARPIRIAARLVSFDYWVMVGVSVGFVLLAAVGRKRIGRPAGMLLLGVYLCYIVFLLIASRQ